MKEFNRDETPMSVEKPELRTTSGELPQMGGACSSLSFRHPVDAG